MLIVLLLRKGRIYEPNSRNNQVVAWHNFRNLCARLHLAGELGVQADELEKRMSKTLLQIHHQFPDGTTDICAQREVDGYGDLKRFIDDTVASHPLPVGAKWLLVPEDSPLFVMMELPPQERREGN